MPNYVAGRGKIGAKLMIVGEAPGRIEDEQGLPFVGPSGEMLNGIFQDCGLPNWRDECYVTNVYKYRPPYNIIKRVGEVCNPQSQVEDLWREIQEIRPNCILALGATALEVLTGSPKILTYRGSILHNQRYGIPKVVPTIHPANLVRASQESGNQFEHIKFFPYIWRNIMLNDVQRAIEESKTLELNLPIRQLLIARNSLDVYRFLQRNKHRYEHLHADIETYRSVVPSCISLSFDRHESISIPLFRKFENVEFCTTPHSDLARIWQMLDELFRNNLVSGQNWKFDQAKMEAIGFKFKGLKSDTMLKAHTVNPELPNKSQEFLASIYTREPYYKDEGREFQYNRHNIDRLFLYNAKDSAVNTEIDDELEKELEELSDLYHTDLKGFYYGYITKLHQFYSDLEKTGFRIDDKQWEFLIYKYESWLDNLQVAIETAAGHPININSPKQVTAFLYDQLHIPVASDRRMFRKTDENTLAILLKDKVKDGFRREVIQNILKYRRVSKTLSTYLYARRDYDGKIRTQYRIIGTETGRSSTSIVDEPVRPSKQGFAFQTLTKHGDVGEDIRSYLVPDSGTVWVNVDLSQAEARVVALLSQDEELLAAFDKIDIHRRTAALVLISGRLNLSHEFDKVADVIGKDSPERFMGKKTRHAGNYNMKWRTFLSEVTADCRRFNIDFNLSPFKAKQILERFHAASPKIKQIFHKEVIEALEATRTLVNPFGRVRRFFDRYSEQLYKEGMAFIPQSSVKDRLTMSALEITRRRFPVRFAGESHDSLLMQMPTGEYLDICREIKPIMEQPIDFSNCTLKRGTLIIPCDFEVGENYKDMEKVRL